MNRSTITSGNRFYTTFGSWWLAWSVIHFSVLVSFGVISTEAIMDSMVSNILLAAFCLFISNNMRYYLPRQERYWYILAISFGLSCIWLLLVRFILWMLFKKDVSYMSLLLHSSTIRYAIAFLLVACMAMISLLWYTLQEQKENDQRKEEAEKMAKDAELLKLRQQLQPHFLFNSLNSISALAGSQPEKARHMIEQLSDFLRGTLKKEDHQSVTLEEEMHHLQLYLDIEKVRFGQRLQTRILLDEDTKALYIPTLLLQPIVENAIKFGLYDTTGEVMITITATQQNKQLSIIITNPFDEDTAVSTQGTGFGLASIHRRLFLLFARHDLLHTFKTDAIFTTTLLIPQYNYESSNH